MVIIYSKIGGISYLICSKIQIKKDSHIKSSQYQKPNHNSIEKVNSELNLL